MTVRQFLNYAYAMLVQGLDQDGVKKIDAFLDGTGPSPTSGDGKSTGTKSLIAMMGMARA